MIDLGLQHLCSRANDLFNKMIWDFCSYVVIDDSNPYRHHTVLEILYGALGVVIGPIYALLNLYIVYLARGSVY